MRTIRRSRLPCPALGGDMYPRCVPGPCFPGISIPSRSTARFVIVGDQTNVRFYLGSRVGSSTTHYSLPTGSLSHGRVFVCRHNKTIDGGNREIVWDVWENRILQNLKMRKWYANILQIICKFFWWSGFAKIFSWLHTHAGSSQKWGTYPLFWEWNPGCIHNCEGGIFRRGFPVE